jgi:hypothetical protein
VIVAFPGATPVTRPVAELTVATEGALDVHVTTRPGRGLRLASCAVAEINAVLSTNRATLVGVVTTNATGTSETVMVALALFPSLVAVILAVPAATAVTAPFASTVATPGMLDDHAIARPVRTFPPASLSTAAIVVPEPTTRLALGGVSATVATGASATEMDAVPLMPSLVAVIVALPAATPVTTPADETLAMDGALDVHVTVRPANTFPPASFVTAVSVVLPPTSKVALVGVTETDATGTADTVTAVVPLLPSHVAVMFAVPIATAVTSPLLDTVATVGALDVQVIVRPDSVAPFASRTVAEMVVVPPTIRVALVGFTATDATGIGVVDVTTTCATPVLPSAVALIVVVPGAIAVTRPSVLTSAIVGSADFHVIGRPPSTLPFASVAIAVSDCDWPTVNAADPGAIAIAAIGITATVMVADAVLPSLVAVIVAVPAETPITFPVASTLATCVAPLAQTTDRPVSTC